MFYKIYETKRNCLIKILGLCCVAVIIVIGIRMAIPSKTLDFREFNTILSLQNKFPSLYFNDFLILWEYQAHGHRFTTDKEIFFIGNELGTVQNTNKNKGL